MKARMENFRGENKLPLPSSNTQNKTPPLPPSPSSETISQTSLIPQLPSSPRSRIFAMRLVRVDVPVQMSRVEVLLDLGDFALLVEADQIDVFHVERFAYLRPRE